MFQSEFVFLRKVYLDFAAVQGGCNFATQHAELLRLTKVIPTRSTRT